MNLRAWRDRIDASARVTQAAYFNGSPGCDEAIAAADQ